jgi:hypothetical protein
MDGICPLQTTSKKKKKKKKKKKVVCHHVSAYVCFLNLILSFSHYAGWNLKKAASAANNIEAEDDEGDADDLPEDDWWKYATSHRLHCSWHDVQLKILQQNEQNLIFIPSAPPLKLYFYTYGGVLYSTYSATQYATLIFKINGELKRTLNKGLKAIFIFLSFDLDLYKAIIYYIEMILHGAILATFKV